MTEPTPEYIVERAATPWRRLRLDVVLGGIAILAPLASLAADVSFGCIDWFPRSGAIATLIGGILAFRSLNRHYVKFLAAFGRGFPLATSHNQWVVDMFTLCVAVGGTIIWAYGDKMLYLRPCV